MIISQENTDSSQKSRRSKGSERTDFVLGRIAVAALLVSGLIWVGFLYTEQFTHTLPPRVKYHSLAY